MVCAISKTPRKTPFGALPRTRVGLKSEIIYVNLSTTTSTQCFLQNLNKSTPTKFLNS